VDGADTVTGKRCHMIY